MRATPGRTPAPRNRSRERLSAVAVTNFVKQPRPEKTRLLHDGAGLYLAYDKRGGLSWLFKYRFDGKPRTMGLGPWPDVKLAAARLKHEDARRKLKSDRVDPLGDRAKKRAERRAAAAKAMTFRQASVAWIAAHEAGWGAKTTFQRTSMLKRLADPTLGDLDVRDIDVHLVLKVLEQKARGRQRLWVAMPETGRKLRSYMEAIFGWAAAKNFRAKDNPAGWDTLKHLLPAHDKVDEVEHHPALPYIEASAFLAKLKEQEGAAARALEFTMLTATRTTEVLRATWGEVDLAAKTWTVPLSRRKTRKKDKNVHRVPLSEPTVAILEALKPKVADDEDFVFPGLKKGAPLSNMAMLKVLERMGRPDLTVHGLRSTFRDWGAEMTNFPRDLLEKSLSHVVGDETERAYQRGDLLERRARVMEAWANYCLGGAGKRKAAMTLRNQAPTKAEAA